MKRVAICMAIAGMVWGPGLAVADDSPVKDTWLTSKTKARLFADKRVKATAVTVDTDDRVVTLRGKVRTAEEKLAAEQIARGTDGVRGVNNVLQVVSEGQRRLVDARDGDIKQSVKNRLEADAMLKEADISVRSDAGVVTLKGNVPDTRARTRAADLTRGVSGVKSVRNELKAKDTRAAAAPRTPR